MSPPELQFKFWPIIINAKGQEAIQAVRRPLAFLIVVVVPLALGGAVYGGYRLGALSGTLAHLKNWLM